MVKKVFFVASILAVIAFTVALSRFFLQTRQNKEERIKKANLIIYTHSSFMDPYGPGPELKREFEKNCDCTVEYVDAGGAQMAIERMKLDPSRRVDLVLGLDHILLSNASAAVRFQDLATPPIPFQDELKGYRYPRFVPYDWSPMGIVYRKGEVDEVSSWGEVFEKWPDRALVLQDPTLSTPGLEWLYWLYLEPRELTKSFVDLNRVVLSFSPSWSAAYGLFRKGQAKATFSYLTSLLYHWIEDKDQTYQFMKFKEGHPVQVEYAAVPESCWNCGSAKQFVAYLLSPGAQKILAEKNYMLPVRTDITLRAEFTQLPKVELIATEKLDEFIKNRTEILQLWQKSHR